MPYINQEDRAALLSGERVAAQTAGELNFVITQAIRTYFWSKGGSYQTINDIVGALEGAKAEFQRRVVAPYEDFKIKQNGDIY
jgi:hypothetical protein